MKFLSIGTLATASSLISNVDAGDLKIVGRVEAYACSRAGPERHIEEEIGRHYSSSPQSISPFGPMEYRRNRDILVDLISTLNVAFPDYDFSDVRAHQFVKEDTNQVLEVINSRLQSVIPHFENIKPQLWHDLDSEIRIAESTIYSFHPDPECNPFEDDGNLWSFNYFFYNKKGVKRILLFTCSAQWRDKMEEAEDMYQDWRNYAHNLGDNMDDLFDVDMLLDDD